MVLINNHDNTINPVICGMSLFSQTSTFQCVFAISGNRFYVLFLYADGKMQATGYNYVGYYIGRHVQYFIPESRPCDNFNVTEASNVNIPGMYVFRQDAHDPVFRKYDIYSNETIFLKVTSEVKFDMHIFYNVTVLTVVLNIIHDYYNISYRESDFLSAIFCRVHPSQDNSMRYQNSVTIFLNSSFFYVDRAVAMHRLGLPVSTGPLLGADSTYNYI